MYVFYQNICPITPTPQSPVQRLEGPSTCDRTYFYSFRSLVQCKILHYAASLSLGGIHILDTGNSDEGLTPKNANIKSLCQHWFSKNKDEILVSVNMKYSKCNFCIGTLRFSICADKGEERTGNILLGTLQYSPCFTNTSTSGIPYNIKRRSITSTFTREISQLYQKW